MPLPHAQLTQRFEFVTAHTHPEDEIDTLTHLKSELQFPVQHDPRADTIIGISWFFLFGSPISQLVTSSCATRCVTLTLYKKNWMTKSSLLCSNCPVGSSIMITSTADYQHRQYNQSQAHPKEQIYSGCW
ncbi:hypothetical protein CVS40_6725 [Lucilia cuprina]|nr:hypothetical protein CVS40_6725 [Lucilia cuprina]